MRAVERNSGKGAVHDACPDFLMVSGRAGQRLTQSVDNDGMVKHGRRQRVYDHRLRELVRQTGDARIATDCGVPRTTAAGWLCTEAVEAVTLDVLEAGEVELRADVLKLRRRVRLLQGVVGVLVGLLCVPAELERRD